MNIYDIAKLAGVSIATVSRVVNGSPKVSERTKQKVLAVMAENNYTPNMFARGLGLDSMKTVGIICPDVSDHYMASAVAYLEKRFRSYGYDCILYCSGYTPDDHVQTVQLIRKKKIDALLLVGSHYVGDGSDEAVRYLEEASRVMPVFLINGYTRHPAIHCVVADAHRIMYDTVCALIQAGRKDILFLYDALTYSAMRKMAGYEDALRDNGLPVVQGRKIFVPNSIATVRETLSKLPLPSFDAVLATEDGLAIGAMKFAGDCGLSVPDDVNIIGYNDSELAVCCEPELTSIDSRNAELCKKAVDDLMSLLEGKEPPHTHIVSCRLTKRGTTDF